MNIDMTRWQEKTVHCAQKVICHYVSSGVLQSEKRNTLEGRAMW